MKLFLKNYLSLVLLSLLTLFSCVEKSTTDSNNPPTTPSAPSLAINYGISEDFYIALTNTPLELTQKENFGSQLRFSVSPNLPRGLSLDITNGSISGTPTIASLPILYTITATKGSTGYTKVISLGVAPSQVWITNINSLDPYRLMAYVVGDGSQQNGVNWSSSNPSLATVNNGVVDFKDTTTGGTALISATKNNYSGRVSFTVDRVEVVNDEKIITKGIDVSLIISSGAKITGANQFTNKGLTSVVFPDSLIYINSSSFYQNQLRSVIIPNNVFSIDEDAFRDNLLTNVVIGNSVTYIGNSAFRDNQLRSVVIPNSVSDINEYAFRDNQLTSVVIPNSLTTIGNSAFRNNQLTSVVIPNSLTTIGNSAFRNNQLRSVVIPNSFTTISGSAFRNNQLTNLVIPNSVTTIGNNAFQYNQLTRVVIPDSVTNLGQYVFAENQLTSVVIPNSLTTISAAAFYNNNQLRSVVIPNNVKSIGGFAFFNNRLTSVLIPDNVTNVGNSAFTSNPNLVEVSLKQSLYTEIINTSSTNDVFGSQVTNYIKRL